MYILRHFIIALALIIAFPAIAQTWGTAAQTPASAPLVIAVSGKVFADIHEGKPLGVIAEAADQVARQMGLTTRYIVMSEKEMLPKLKSGEVAIGGALLLGKDTDSVLFSQPLLREYNVLIVRRGNEIPLHNIKDLDGKKLGSRIGFTYPLLENHNNFTLVRNDKDGENIRGLFLNKLDMAVVASVSDIYEFNSEGIMSELMLLDKAVGYVDLGLAFSVTALGNDKIAQFRQALTNLLTSTQWQQILGRNGVDNLVHDWPMIIEDQTGGKP